MGRLRMVGIPVVVLLAGCGSSQDRRVADLEKRITELEKEIAQLKSGQAKVANTDSTSLVSYHSDWVATPLEPAVEKGLAWLVSVQGVDGGWGQDGGKDGDARKDVNLESSGNDVANTALVALALIRGGNTRTAGPYHAALDKAVAFILSHVETSPDEGLSITKRTGTQIQRKLGPYIDTFLATMVLSQVDATLTEETLRRPVHAALTKCVAKIEKNQQKDGSWNVGGGWAPVLSTSLASRGLFAAQNAGVKVAPGVLEKAQGYSKFTFSSTDSAAGVDLYNAGQAMEQLSRTDKDRKANAGELKEVASKLDNEQFFRGFGSMGGEEFVSYLNISDSLIRTRDEAWTKWNGKIKERLLKLQNQDGTWAGHHCITGRVACTSAAVLTILTERTSAKL